MGIMWEVEALRSRSDSRDKEVEVSLRVRHCVDILS